jgi:DNA-binding response OmpR family regulator
MIYFPSVKKNTVIEPTEAAEPVPWGTNETILFVEDDETTRELVKEALTQCGYRVITAPDCETALSIYSKTPADFDLIISDLIMPGIGGKKLVENLLAINPRVRIIIASGYNVQDNELYVKEWGAKDFLSKPYEINKILKVIRKTLSSS